MSQEVSLKVDRTLDDGALALRPIRLRPAGFDVAWDDVNFFDNDFSSDCGALSFDPLGGLGSGYNSDDGPRAEKSLVDKCYPSRRSFGASKLIFRR